MLLAGLFYQVVVIAFIDDALESLSCKREGQDDHGTPRRALGAGRANVGTPPGVPLFIGLLDRSPIGVVFIGCALRGRVPIAALCISISIFFRVRRATGNCPNDLIYYAWFLWCTISGILCEPDGRYKHECCRGHCCYELHGKSPVVRIDGSGGRITPSRITPRLPT